MSLASRYSLEETFARCRAADYLRAGDAERAQWWTLQADTACRAADAERSTRGAGRAAIRRAHIPRTPPPPLPPALRQPEPDPAPAIPQSENRIPQSPAAFAFAATGHPDMEQCLAIYAESLPELSEAELIDDLAAAEDAGRPDTAALIEEELRRRSQA